MLGQSASTDNTDKWTSGNIEINRWSIKFPTSEISIANISFVGCFKFSWKKYIRSAVCFFIGGMTIENEYLSGGLIYLFSSKPFWIGVFFLALAWLFFPRYRHYVLINSNSSRSQIVVAKTKKSANDLREAIVRYMQHRDNGNTTIFDVSGGELTVKTNVIEGDIVSGNKNVSNQTYNEDKLYG